LADNADPYVPRHDPFVFFDDINGWDERQLNRTPRCIEHLVDYSQLDADLAQPGFGEADVRRVERAARPASRRVEVIAAQRPSASALHS
jgi:hypothetical protein